MKQIIIIIITLLTLNSCDTPGTTTMRLTGTEANLPEELKGLKIYNIATGSGNYVKVAILDNKVNSTTYKIGKHAKSTIILNTKIEQAYKVRRLISESDSILVFLK
jgi:hypothetical protein